MVNDDFNLSWVHISDLHFGQAKYGKDQLQEEIVIDRLIEDLKECREVFNDLIPYVFITGDVAFSAQSHEYKKATKFISQLEKIGLDKNKIYIVPGNHDVDRKTFVKKRTKNSRIDDTYSSLRKTPAKIDNHLVEAKTAFKNDIWFKLNQYCSFIKTKSFQEITHQKVFWSENKADNLCFVGLNSTLLSYDDTDSPTNLALGKQQIKNALSDENKDKLLVVLQHHPPDWLLVDKQTFLNVIGDRPHLILCGHTHSQQVTINLDLGQKEYITFNAGSAYEKEGESHKLIRHTYYLGKLEKKGLTFWPRAWSRGKEKFDADREFFSTTKEDYVFHPAEKLPSPLAFWLTKEEKYTPPETDTSTTEKSKKVQTFNSIVEMLNQRAGNVCEKFNCEMQPPTTDFGVDVYEFDAKILNSLLLIKALNALANEIEMAHERKVSDSSLFSSSVKTFIEKLSTDKVIKNENEWRDELAKKLKSSTKGAPYVSDIDICVDYLFKWESPTFLIDWDSGTFRAQFEKCQQTIDHVCVELLKRMKNELCLSYCGLNKAIKTIGKK